MDLFQSSPSCTSRDTEKLQHNTWASLNENGVPLSKLATERQVLFSTHSLTHSSLKAITTADRWSRSFESSQHPEEGYKDEAARVRAEQEAQKSSFERFMDFGKEYRYPIVGTSWVLGMGIALGLVVRSPYLSTQQKLVQARVYAQTITIAVLCATAVFEVGDRGKGEGRWETIKIVDPNDPTHKHLIDKKIHHERYEGEDQWRGGFSLLLWCLRGGYETRFMADV